MRGERSVGLGCALLAALTAALLAGCQRSSPDGAGANGRDGRTTPAGHSASADGARFLAVDECSSFGTESFTEAPCTSERAAARVVARYDGRAGGGPLCPATTDFVLHISAQRPTDEDGNASIPQGYACMRNLEPPHPGDPGGGGGPRTIVGDCVYGTGKGKVRETACDGSDRRKPQYKVTGSVTARTKCPASTALYVQLGGTAPVGCARRL